MIRLVFAFSLIVIGCSESKLDYKKMSNEEINSTLGQIKEDDTVYTQKGVAFDSIVTLAGNRSLDKDTRIKMKIFYFGNHCRGYFNMPDVDTKNLQFFGKNINGNWVMKCVTKLNMEEVGGYMFLYPHGNDIKGIWSNGHVNFVKGDLSLSKQMIDYNSLTSW